MAMGLFTDRPATASSGSAKTNVEHTTDRTKNVGGGGGGPHRAALMSGRQKKEKVKDFFFF